MNAIILAAGMGMRLRPLTDDKPKALVETCGESFFTRQLRLLAAAGVDDITVVTGYKAEAFAPYLGLPGLHFVYNEHFHDRNNLFSMYLVREALGDSLVLEGDVWLGEGVLPVRPPEASSWFVGYREDMKREWVVRVDDQDRVSRIDVESGAGWILSGLSYWNLVDGRAIAGLIEKRLAEPGFEELFWDDIPRANLDSLRVMARRIGPEDWFEIDTLEDREALQARFSR
jgi:CTP:phosphocholine cytidylyltransferase-like protein